MFGGCSSDQHSIIEGCKVPNSDTLNKDENRVYHIICKDSDVNRNILKKYKKIDRNISI